MRIFLFDVALRRRGFWRKRENFVAFLCATSGMHSRDQKTAGSMTGKEPGAISLPGRDLVVAIWSTTQRTQRNLYGNDASTLDAGIYEMPLDLRVLIESLRLLRPHRHV